MKLLEPKNDNRSRRNFDDKNKLLAANYVPASNDDQEDDCEDIGIEVKGFSASPNELTDFDDPTLDLRLTNQQNKNSTTGSSTQASQEHELETSFCERKKKMCVSFGKVHVHTHRLRLGDNPAVSHGPPTELEWNSVASECFDLGDYQDKNSPRSGPKRISIQSRYALLYQGGYSLLSILHVDHEIRNIKISRQQTREEYQREKQLMKTLIEMRKREKKVRTKIAEALAKKEKEMQKAKENVDEYKHMATTRLKKGKRNARDSCRKWPSPPSPLQTSRSVSSKSSRRLDIANTAVINHHHDYRCLSRIQKEKTRRSRYMRVLSLP